MLHEFPHLTFFLYSREVVLLNKLILFEMHCKWNGAEFIRTQSVISVVTYIIVNSAMPIYECITEQCLHLMVHFSTNVSYTEWSSFEFVSWLKEIVVWIFMIFAFFFIKPFRCVHVWCILYDVLSLAKSIWDDHCQAWCQPLLAVSQDLRPALPAQQ